jgi:4-amino-4-deoxy-L-arabinose transferase-like glycosyltransferase
MVPEAAGRPWRLPLALGLAAGLSVVLTLAGPGVTIDEPLDVRPGRTYVTTLLSRGLGFFESGTVVEVFRDNAEHPPLGRWLLGIASTIGQPVETLWLGADPHRPPLYVLSGRLAPALTFAALVALVTHTAARRYGNPSGAAAGFALAVMPRAFAHAHLGALDTFIAFFWVAALCAADRALTSRRPVAAMMLAGAVWALALLTKIHAWFLIPVVAVWSPVRLRTPGRTLVAFAAWVTTGLALFVAGWPWLWYDTASRLRAYLGTGVVRATIRVLYFGTVYADRDVPWHYPWVYFVLTVPVGLHVLGLIGLADRLRDVRRGGDPFPLLVVSSIGLFLLVFSTKIPVYDGERLFLPAFPLWALFVGVGFGVIWEKWGKTNLLKVCLFGILVCQVYGVCATYPFGLSYYNALIGGLPGAEKLGLELTYWGDAVDGALLDALARAAVDEAPAALVPTLYPGQGIAVTSRPLARRSLVLGDQEDSAAAHWLVVSRRTAYWPPGFAERLVRGRVVVSRERQGVWLSRLIEVPPGGTGDH